MICKHAPWPADSSGLITLQLVRLLIAPLCILSMASFAAEQPFVINANALLPAARDAAIAWGDYDNDRDLDIVMTSERQTNRSGIYRNQGDGTFFFADIGLPGLRNASLAWADFNRDGDLDFFVEGESERTGPLIRIYWNNGHELFAPHSLELPGVVRIRTLDWGDYDRDGLPDIALTGYRAEYPPDIAQIWRNTGEGFQKNTVTLTPFELGAAGWGDFNHDGWLDLLITGTAGQPMPFNRAEIWLYTSEGFSRSDFSFEGVSQSVPWSDNKGSIALADYDNDGNLDVLLAGANGYPFATNTAALWRNTGAGFVKIDARLPGADSCAWGDFDNDGRPDILLTAATANWNEPGLTEVFRNTGAGFEILHAGITPLKEGSAVWGDYNADGRLDILLAGLELGLDEAERTEVWQNSALVSNTPPQAPSGLRATVGNDGVTLAWNASTDAETPNPGLSYNVRIGTRPGAVDVLSPDSDIESGCRRVPAPGNAGQRLSLRLSNPSRGVFYWSVQAVDTGFAGSPFAAEECFSLPAATLPVSNLTARTAVLSGELHPVESETICWFEYGLTIQYGHSTPPEHPVAMSNTVRIAREVTGLLSGMSYHYRLAASNSLGVTYGADRFFTVPAAENRPPSISGLNDLAITQGDRVTIPFQIFDPDTPPSALDLRVRCNNRVLLPTGSLVLGGSGTNRTLAIIPDPDHSGSALITASLSDDAVQSRASFTLTVTPEAQPQPLLYLTNAHLAPPPNWRFRVVSAGMGLTNCTFEHRPDFSVTNSWAAATNVTPVAEGWFQVEAGPAPSGYYRARASQLQTAGLAFGDFISEEGEAMNGPVIEFDGPYLGTVNYRWTSAQGTTGGSLAVNGSTAVIPMPIPDNANIEQTRLLTLRLEAGPELKLAGTSQSTVTIQENDAEWQGVIQLELGSLCFLLRLNRMDGSWEGSIRSDQAGFFPIHAQGSRLGVLQFTENRFLAMGTNIPIDLARNGSPLFDKVHSVSLRLEAANGPGQSNVASTEIRGVATLVSLAPDRPCLDAAMSGPFVLLKPPGIPATNDIPLLPAPLEPNSSKH